MGRGTIRHLAMLVFAFVVVVPGALLAQQEAPGFLGVALQDLTKDEADALRWEAPRGAKVATVMPGTPAAIAGLKRHDILVSLDGFEIENVKSFFEALRKKAAGTEIRLSVRRERHEKRIVVTLGTLPAQYTAAAPNDLGPQLVLDTGGHMATINSIVFTPDGRQLVSGSIDKTIRVWDLATGKTVRILRGEIAPGDPGKIYGVALSPDGKWLAAAGSMPVPGKDGHYIRLYDFASGRLVARLEGHEEEVYAVAFSHDGRYLISGSADKTAIIWDLGILSRVTNEAAPSGAPVTLRPWHRLRGHRDYVFGVAFTPDGKRAVTSSDDHDLRLWRVESGEQIARMTGHNNKVESLDIAADGTIASGDDNGEIRLWDGKTGAFRRVLVREDRAVGDLSFSPDGKRLLTGVGFQRAKNDCHVYDIASGREIVSYSGHNNVVFATAISPDGRWAATAGGDNHEIHSWDLQTGERRLGPDGQPLTLGGKGRPVWATGFSADGKRIGWGNQREGDDRIKGYGPIQFVLTLPLPANTTLYPHQLGLSVSFTGEVSGNSGHSQDEKALLRGRPIYGEWSLQHRKGSNYGYGRRYSRHQASRGSGRLNRARLGGWVRSYQLQLCARWRDDYLRRRQWRAHSL